MRKRISPAAVVALKEALTHAFWFKKDLRSFVSQVLSDTAILSRVNWEGYKRNSVSTLVDYMARHEARHQDDLLALIEALIQFEDFSHLERLEDGATKAAQARAAIEGLRRHGGHYAHLQEEKRRAARERERRMRAQEAERGVRESLDQLHTRFLRIVTEDPQRRGYSLEQFLPQLFAVFDVDAKASFRLVGEQIDGGFTFDGLDWLFECKWQAKPVGAVELDSFGGKIQRKLDNTLGLFLSINGFSDEGIRAYSQGRSVMILMDGSDLTAVVEGRIPFDLLIRRKRAHAAQKGEIFLPVSALLS